MFDTKKKVYFIINPVSGRSSKQNLPLLIGDALGSDIFDVEIFETQYAGHGSEIAQRAIDQKVDYVIAVGGDGTVNEVGSTLVGSDTALGIIPMGSGNGLARELNISTQTKKALSIIAEQHIIKIDYGIANGRIFFCTCGVGFDAVVAEKVSGKKSRGSLMYLQKVLESFIEQKPETYEITCPEGKIKDKAFVVTCANASQYGYNAHIAPHADIQDGLMNVAILKPLSILDVPQTTVQLFTKKIDDNKKMLELMTREVRIKRTKEGVMHIDGDHFHEGKEIHVEIIPQGLKVLVPRKPPKKSPLDPLEMIISMLKSI